METLELWLPRRPADASTAKYYGDFEIAGFVRSAIPLIGDPLAADRVADATGGKDDRRYILSQLLELFALCQERNINLPDIYREAERIADPEPDS